MAENPDAATGADAQVQSWTGDDFDEVELLNKIVLEGFDQGCFLRPEAEDLIEVSEQAEILNVCADRARASYSEEDPFAESPVVESSIEGLDSGFVIVSQRCDLVRCLRDEPLVELAQADHNEDRAVISIASKNSPRLLHLADSQDGAWIVDLRKRAAIPKVLLPKHEVVLPIPAGRARRDFAQRIGRRYSRKAIPDDIAMGFQSPVAKWVRSSNERVKQSHLFSELLTYRDEDEDNTLVFIGLVADSVDHTMAQAIFERWVAELKPKVKFKIADESSTMSAESMPLAMWKDAYKLDLHENSRGPKATEDTALAIE